jgi:hypothetical protein
LLAAALSVSAQESQEEVQRLAERTKGASDDWLLGRDLWNEPFQPYR